jgi:hypothetical protein
VRARHSCQATAADTPALAAGRKGSRPPTTSRPMLAGGVAVAMAVTVLSCTPRPAHDRPPGLITDAAGGSPSLLCPVEVVAIPAEAREYPRTGRGRPVNERYMVLTGFELGLGEGELPLRLEGSTDGQLFQLEPVAVRTRDAGPPSGTTYPDPAAEFALVRHLRRERACAGVVLSVTLGSASLAALSWLLVRRLEQADRRSQRVRRALCNTGASLVLLTGAGLFCMLDALRMPEHEPYRLDREYAHVVCFDNATEADVDLVVADCRPVRLASGTQQRVWVPFYDGVAPLRLQLAQTGQLLEAVDLGLPSEACGRLPSAPKPYLVYNVCGRNTYEPCCGTYRSHRVRG